MSKQRIPANIFRYGLLTFTLALNLNFFAADCAEKPKPVPKEIKEILDNNNCSSCHRAYHRLVGPPFVLIKDKNYTAEQMAELIAKPVPENWPGYPKMTPFRTISIDDVKKLKAWMDTLEPEK